MSLLIQVLSYCKSVPGKCQYSLFCVCTVCSLNRLFLSDSLSDAPEMNEKIVSLLKSSVWSSTFNFVKRSDASVTTLTSDSDVSENSTFKALRICSTSLSSESTGYEKVTDKKGSMKSFLDLIWRKNKIIREIIKLSRWIVYRFSTSLIVTVREIIYDLQIVKAHLTFPLLLPFAELFSRLKIQNYNNI